MAWIGSVTSGAARKVRSAVWLAADLCVGDAGSTAVELASDTPDRAILGEGSGPGVKEGVPMGVDVIANTEAQRRLYGASLRDLARGVMASLELTQGRLADVLGVSAPMLSQLMSGHRVKIGDPAVVHRLSNLLALSGESASLSPEARAARLRAIRGSRCALLTVADPRSTHAAALAELRTLAPAEELLEAAGVVGIPGLSALLREAAEAPAQ